MLLVHFSTVFCAICQTGRFHLALAEDVDLYLMIRTGQLFVGVAHKPLEFDSLECEDQLSQLSCINVPNIGPAKWELVPSGCYYLVKSGDMYLSVDRKYLENEMCDSLNARKKAIPVVAEKLETPGFAQNFTIANLLCAGGSSEKEVGRYLQIHPISDLNDHEIHNFSCEEGSRSHLHHSGGFPGQNGEDINKKGITGQEGTDATFMSPKGTNDLTSMLGRIRTCIKKMANISLNQERMETTAEANYKEKTQTINKLKDYTSQLENITGIGREKNVTEFGRRKNISANRVGENMTQLPFWMQEQKIFPSCHTISELDGDQTFNDDMRDSTLKAGRTNYDSWESVSNRVNENTGSGMTPKISVFCKSPENSNDHVSSPGQQVDSNIHVKNGNASNSRNPDSSETQISPENLDDSGVGANFCILGLDEKSRSTPADAIIETIPGNCTMIDELGNTIRESISLDPRANGDTQDDQFTLGRISGKRTRTVTGSFGFRWATRDWIRDFRQHENRLLLELLTCRNDRPFGEHIKDSIRLQKECEELGGIKSRKSTISDKPISIRGCIGISRSDRCKNWVNGADC